MFDSASRFASGGYGEQDYKRLAVVACRIVACRICAHGCQSSLARRGGGFQEHRLNSKAPLVPALADSVLLLPAMVSKAECTHLAAAADQWCLAHSHTFPLTDYHRLSLSSFYR